MLTGIWVFVHCKFYILALLVVGVYRRLPSQQNPFFLIFPSVSTPSDNLPLGRLASITEWWCAAFWDIKISKRLWGKADNECAGAPVASNSIFIP